MIFAEALFTRLERFTATRLGMTAYFVPNAAFDNNRGTLAIPDKPDVPASWVEVVLDEVEPTRAENFTGLLGSNPDVLTGEIPTERAFLVQAFYFTEPPTIDDRIIIQATGQNYSIAGVDAVNEIGATVAVFRLLCRVLG